MPAPDWVDALDGDYLYAHVASPNVHIDEANQRLVMYYHGLLPGGDQQTRLATSTDGINFKPKEPLLGPPYFRATKLDGMIYLSMWEGRLGRTRVGKVQSTWHRRNFSPTSSPGLQIGRSAMGMSLPIKGDCT